MHEVFFKTIIIFNKFEICYNQYFQLRIHQFINSKYRCNFVAECEDGTDEENCTCRDHLRHFGAFRALICNGEVDCLDFSDEVNCCKIPKIV